MPRMTEGVSTQMAAFLSMITLSELSKFMVANSDGGYNVLSGSTDKHILTFSSYADHPRTKRQIVIAAKPSSPGRTAAQVVPSSAAGAYQILAKNYDAYKQMLSLPDFSPISQDAICLQMVRECHAASNIEAGHLAMAIRQCAHLWASFPGAGYKQNEKSYLLLAEYFRQSGGRIT